MAYLGETAAQALARVGLDADYRVTTGEGLLLLKRAGYPVSRSLFNQAAHAKEFPYLMFGGRRAIRVGDLLAWATGRVKSWDGRRGGWKNTADTQEAVAA